MDALGAGVVGATFGVESEGDDFVLGEVIVVDVDIDVTVDGMGVICEEKTYQIANYLINT